MVMLGSSIPRMDPSSTLPQGMMMVARLEGFRPTRQHLVVDEISRWLEPRHQRLQRILDDEDLLPEERDSILLIQGELGALAAIVIGELLTLDEKTNTTAKSITDAKLQARSNGYIGGTDAD
jgi:hypothetical protein